MSHQHVNTKQAAIGVGNFRFPLSDRKQSASAEAHANAMAIATLEHASQLSESNRNRSMTLLDIDELVCESQMGPLVKI